jgi:hypothetical protein
VFLKTVLNIFPTSFPITNMLLGADSSANCYGGGVDELSLGGGVVELSLGGGVFELSLGGGVDDDELPLSLGADLLPLSLGADLLPLLLGADDPPSLLETELSVVSAGFFADVFPLAALILAHASGNSRTKYVVAVPPSCPIAA